MSPAANDLLRDPLFQLNTLLWLAQPLHAQARIAPRPVLHEQGFVVHAVAPPLALPVNLALHVKAQGARVNLQGHVRPDVVLAHEVDRKYAFIECKASAFGPDSSTAEQARTLMVVAGPQASDVLGLPAQHVSVSLAAFLIPEEDRPLLAHTLTHLADELHINGVASGTWGVLGLAVTGGDLSLLTDQEGVAFFGLPPTAVPFMTVEPDTDPRPLYLIPYDPDVDQTEEQRSFCRRVLLERLRSAVIAAVGRASPPAAVALRPDNLLNEAMFGMYDHWENHESARHLKHLCRHLMGALARAVNGVVQCGMVFQREEGWIIRLPDRDQHDKVMHTLWHFSCEKLESVADQQLSFLDDLESTELTV